MKKARLFTLLALMITFTLFIFVGCIKEEAVSSVSLKDHDPESVVEMVAGDFDYGAYTLLVSYESGKTAEVALEEKMIAESDLFKFYQIGDHSITVSYQGQEYVFKISVKRSAFSNLRFAENNVFTYDGMPHTVEVEGDIPANAVITYPGGNTFVNAGTYDVVAIVSCEGYVTEKLSATVKIERAKYDMSEVKFEAKEFVYDGKAHSVAISGALPEGVSAPTYTIDGRVTSSATNAGEYTVKASFATKDPNYEKIPDMVTTLKILPAEYTVKGVEVVFKNGDGAVLEELKKVYDGQSVSFDLADYSKLSSKISVFFAVYDKVGNLVSDSNKNTNILNAGVYTVKVGFDLAGGENYKPITPLVYEFEVLKAPYPALENVQLASYQATYDGKAHSILIEGQLPEGVTVSYEYYRANVLLVDGDGNPVQSVTDTGIYTVKAVFTHNDINLSEIPDMSTTLNLKKAVIALSAIGFTGESAVEYSGAPYDPTFTSWKDIFGLERDIFKYSAVKYYVLNSSGSYVEMAEGQYPTEVGSYRVSVDVSIADEYKGNYVLSGTSDVYTLIKQFEIVKKQLALPSVTFTNTSYQSEYTGQVQTVGYTCEFDSVLTTASALYYKYVSGVYVAMGSSELPTEAGSYKFVVTVSVNDVSRYVFSNGEDVMEFTFEYDILPKEIDVSGITLSYTEVSFSGNAQAPDVLAVPEHVNATLRLYSLNGTSSISEAVNAGKYRLEVLLSPESSNYVLSSKSKLVLYFEILPAEIDVSNLQFDNLEFAYDGNLHYPTLKDLPEHVQASLYLHWGDNENNNLEEYEGRRLAVDVGNYGCRITLRAENSNYKLVGPTTFTTKFVIVRGEVIDLSTRYADDFVLQYTEEGYDDDDLQALVLDGISQYVEWLPNAYRIEVEEGKWEYSATMQARGRYKVQVMFRLLDPNNYSLLYNCEYHQQVIVDLYFTVV